MSSIIYERKRVKHSKGSDTRGYNGCCVCYCTKGLCMSEIGARHVTCGSSGTAENPPDDCHQLSGYVKQEREVEHKSVSTEHWTIRQGHGPRNHTNQTREMRPQRTWHGLEAWEGPESQGRWTSNKLPLSVHCILRYLTIYGILLCVVCVSTSKCSLWAYVNMSSSHDNERSRLSWSIVGAKYYKW